MIDVRNTNVFRGDETAHKIHINHKKSPEEEKSKDKQDNDLVFITFNLQQIMNVPRLATGSSFYYQKLT